MYLPVPAPASLPVAESIALFEPVVIFPFAKVRMPPKVGDFAIVIPVVLFNVTLFEKVVALDPEILWATEPLNVIRPVPWINDPLFEKFPPKFTIGLNVDPCQVAPLLIVRFFKIETVCAAAVPMVLVAPVKVTLPVYDLSVTVWAPLALYSIVEVAARVMVGLLVELIAVDVPPENPLVFAVINVPLIVAEPGVVGKEITLEPAFMVELAATVNVFEAAKPMLKFPAENKLPEAMLPT